MAAHSSSWVCGGLSSWTQSKTASLEWSDVLLACLWRGPASLSWRLLALGPSVQRSWTRHPFAESMEPNLACLTGKHIFGLSLPHGANRSLRQEACVHLARTEEGLCLLLRDTTNKAHSRCVLSHVIPPAATSHEPRVPLQLSCGLPPVRSVQLGAVF